MMQRRDESRVQGTLDLRELAAILRHRKWLILAIAIPVIAMAILYSYLRTPVYSATAKIYVRPPIGSLLQPSRPGDISARTETNLATSVAVARLARDNLSPAPPVDELLKHVTADMSEGTQVLSISFSDPDPVRAKQGAKAFADAYLAYRQQQTQGLIQQNVDADTTQLQTIGKQIQQVSTQLQQLPQGSPRRADLQTRLALFSSQSLALQNDLVQLQTITTNPGEVIDPASVPTSPASPRHVIDVVIGIVLGLVLAIGVALVRERSSDAVRTPADLEEGLGAPVLASIPKMGWRGRERVGLVVARGRRTPAADGYRRLRTSLLSMTASGEAKTVLITSAVSGEGKTAVVANLGAGLAEIGRRVIIVSADLRSPALHRLFSAKARDHLGLSEVLSDGVSPSKAIQETDVANLRFVPTGSLSTQLEPVNLLQTERMTELLAACRRDADFVLIDSPAVLGVPDSLVLARLADGVMVVADARRARYEDVTIARDQLERSGGTVIAGVLNRIEVSRRNRHAWRIGGQLLSLHQRVFWDRGRVQPSSGGKRRVEAPAAAPTPGPANDPQPDTASAPGEVDLKVASDLDFDEHNGAKRAMDRTGGRRGAVSTKGGQPDR
jgi:succinoglycan biosynthesis transport protein ExoP